MLRLFYFVSNKKGQVSLSLVTYMMRSFVVSITQSIDLIINCLELVLEESSFIIQDFLLLIFSRFIGRPASEPKPYGCITTSSPACATA